ncbi:MAG: hypothetical protein WCF84_26730 [Anaerolineae bacterium]
MSKKDKPPKAKKVKLRQWLTGKGIANAQAQQLAHENDDNATGEQIATDITAWAQGLPKAA